MDGAAARLHRRRHRHRHHQSGAGLGHRLGGAARAQRHGHRVLQHLPPGGHRHRHRRPGGGLPEPDPAGHRQRPGRHRRPAGRSWPTAASAARRITGAAIREAAASIPERGGPPALIDAYRVGFTTTFNHLMAIATVVALIGAVGSLVLVRQRDFVPSYRPTDAEPGRVASTPGAAGRGTRTPSAGGGTVTPTVPSPSAPSSTPRRGPHRLGLRVRPWLRRRRARPPDAPDQPGRPLDRAPPFAAAPRPPRAGPRSWPPTPRPWPEASPATSIPPPASSS